jgi:hypothetical protein
VTQIRPFIPGNAVLSQNASKFLPVDDICKPMKTKLFICKKFLDTPVFRLIRFRQKVLTVSLPLELFSLEEKAAYCRAVFSFWARDLANPLRSPDVFPLVWLQAYLFLCAGAVRNPSNLLVYLRRFENGPTPS